MPFNVSLSAYVSQQLQYTQKAEVGQPPAQAWKIRMTPGRPATAMTWDLASQLNTWAGGGGGSVALV